MTPQTDRKTSHIAMLPLFDSEVDAMVYAWKAVMEGRTVSSAWHTNTNKWHVCVSMFEDEAANVVF